MTCMPSNVCVTSVIYKIDADWYCAIYSTKHVRAHKDSNAQQQYQLFSHFAWAAITLCTLLMLC